MISEHYELPQEEHQPKPVRPYMSVSHLLAARHEEKYHRDSTSHETMISLACRIITAQLFDIAALLRPISMRDRHLRHLVSLGGISNDLLN